jgi:hypothetical protein
LVTGENDTNNIINNLHNYILHVNRLHLHDKITSAWFFNGHVFGTDEKGGRYKFDIYDNINEKIR